MSRKTRARSRPPAEPSRTDHSVHMSTRQSARLVYEWVTTVGLRSKDYGTYSARRTKASIIYKATGNLRAAQIPLGHTKIENTVRYLGVDVEDTLTLAEGIEVNCQISISQRASALNCLGTSALFVSRPKAARPESAKSQRCNVAARFSRLGRFPE